jgi:magnesium chelatase family protein
MFARVSSMGFYGMEAFMVEVEADISQGLPRFDIVGLPDVSVAESKNRVRSAIKNGNFNFPSSRITVNLAPADTKKEGPLYDLPILIALLVSTRQLRCEGLNEIAFIGELSLNGTVRHVNGALPMVIKAREAGFKAVFLPASNAAEGSVVKGISVYPVETVASLIDHLKGVSTLIPADFSSYSNNIQTRSAPDFCDVKGQFEARKALEVAAAGGHNVLMIGPPGSGKSMLAKRLPSILPDMTFEESLETTKLYSIAGALPDDSPLIRIRPFRSPHHTVSPAGLSGGGRVPRPGEISLAHNGILFLDELPEFSRTAMEVLRQPIEDAIITISRVAGSLTYPCTAMVVCAMNPCPCGYFGHPKIDCTCPKGSAQRYLERVSGPLLDRLDIHIEVPPVEFDKLSSSEKSECSADIKKRVDDARKIQQKRLEGSGITCNAHMTAAMTREFCTPTPAALSLLEDAFERLGLSARAFDKILRIARTAADLDNAQTVDTVHIAQAIRFRSFDRKFWKR